MTTEIDAAREKLRLFTKQDWARVGSLLRCGPLDRSVLADARQALSDFGLEADVSNGCSLSLSITDALPINTVDYRLPLERCF